MTADIVVSRTAARARRGTYSIVARDPKTGALGVAVQSHWFSVGPIVPWARVGVGAVATQANAEVSYGPLALDALERGASAEQALQRLLAADPGADARQVVIVDRAGRVAAHTGAQCIPYAGHAPGDQFCAEANLMASASVWPRMRDAFAATAGRLQDRLMAALDAGEAAGGDVRGRQSAAILVVPGTGAPWETSVSLRVEDHPEPLVELRRLLAVDDAYALAGEADALTASQRHDEAAALYERAAELAPDNHELLFWSGLGAAQAGRLEEAVERVRRAIALQPGWAELLPRLGPETAPGATIVCERLGLTS